jgi:hypothetical protein
LVEFLPILVAALLLIAFQRSSISDARAGWETLEPGLDLGTFPAPMKSEYSDSLIRVLRIDFKYFKPRLLSASATQEKKRRSVRDWVNRNGLVAGINASMYQKDNLTSVSLMKTGKHVNSNWLSKDRTVLAFDPKDDSLPQAQIIDRDCDDFPKLKDLYKSLIQSIRMVSCHRENVWEQRSKKWSTSAIGMDGSGRMLLIHSRSPYSTHDLIKMLLQFPIDIQRAMYVEGGVDAQLYIHSGKKEHEFVGSYSTGSHESDDNRIAWPVPNVIGIERRQ